MNVQGYVQMVKEGKYAEALDIIMEDLPLPGVLGRICPHRVRGGLPARREGRAGLDPQPQAAGRRPGGPARHYRSPARRRGRTEKVAIVGSGPAGLSCAYHLARKGIRSIIFEALSQPGGMLRVGIPAHRLPRDVLDRKSRS